MLFKSLILVNIALILFSLLAGVVFLSRDDSRRRRVVSLLTLRVVLSFTLLALLLIGYYTGQIEPHGL